MATQVLYRNRYDSRYIAYYLAYYLSYYLMKLKYRLQFVLLVATVALAALVFGPRLIGIAPQTPRVTPGYEANTLLPHEIVTQALSETLTSETNTFTPEEIATQALSETLTSEAIILPAVEIATNVPSATPTKRVFLPVITKPASGRARTFYVSTTGSDQNPGSLTQPWKTIQKAANTMVAGDTVFIRGGTYNERVSLSYRSNTTGSYITFINYSDERVILDGTGIAIQHGEGLFNIHKTDFIRVSGLKVQHSNGAGIYVAYSKNIKIDKNYTYDTVKSGISVWASSNVVVDDNDIALACNAHPDYPASEENISIASGSYNVEVMNNYVHKAANIPDGYAGGEGINIKDGAHDVQVHHNVVHLDERTDGKKSNRLAFGLDAWSHETYDVRFYNNVAYNNLTGFVVESEAGATAHDIYVYNNIAYNNSGPGLYIPNWAKNESSLKKNIQFINNTSYNNGMGIYINSVKIENVVIRNNILSQNGTPIQIGSGVPQGQIISDHNLTSGDPLFVNPAEGDFHLQIGSPAIDTGSPLNAPANDFDDNMRPQGKGVDIGASEFRSAQAAIFDRTFSCFIFLFKSLS